MILFTLLGLGASALGMQSGLLIGLLAGFVVANLVPPKGDGCRVRYDDDEGAGKNLEEQDTKAP